MDKLILLLITATVICMILIIIFSISDAIKAKKNQNSANDIGNETNISDNANIDEGANDDLSNNEENVTDNVVDISTKTEAENKVENIPTVNVPTKPLNPPIIKREDVQSIAVEKDNSTAVGFTKENGLKDSYKQLLEDIAQELQKKANSSGDLVINYLGDNKDIVFKDNFFILRNEELICNGILLQDALEYSFKIGDRVTIRFCVNFTVPEGYDIQVITNTLALQSKGLILKDVINARDDSTSIRAVLSVSKPCVIKKSEELFKVKVTKEVVV